MQSGYKREGRYFLTTYLRASSQTEIVVDHRSTKEWKIINCITLISTEKYSDTYSYSEALPQLTVLKLLKSWKCRIGDRNMLYKTLSTLRKHIRRIMKDSGQLQIDQVL